MNSNLTKNNHISAILLIISNALTVVLFALGWIENLNDHAGALSAHGFAYFKYYTVISNALAALVSAVLIIILIIKRVRGGADPDKTLTVPRSIFLAKYITTSMLSVTFLVVAIMLAPQLGLAFVYTGANFWYHLVIPVIAIAEFIVLDRFGTLRFRDTFITLIPTILYATVYWVNILINGRGDPPTTNDIYGILNWGLGIGVLILMIILLLNWGSACLLRIGKRR